MTKVAMETVDAVRRRLAVEIPAGEVTAEIERAYEQLRRKAKVRGFRQGRAPRAVIEQLFGDQVHADVFGRLVRDSLRDALRDQQVEPIGRPEIVTEHAEPGRSLRYSATIEVKPTVVVSGYATLEVERPLRSVGDSDVDRAIEELRNKQARLRPVTDRLHASRGDIATTDFEARIDARMVGRGENRLVEVGGGGADGVGAHLEGMEVGATQEFVIDYPRDHENPELAGRPVSFRVQLKSLVLKDLPPLDDDFAMTQGECQTVAALREHVRKQLEAMAERDANAATRNALVAQLVRAHGVGVPQAMVERRTEALVEECLEYMGPRRPPASREAEVRARLRTELAPRAREHVEASLILEAIADEENLVISEAELDTEVDRIVAGAGSARERVRAIHQDPAARAGVRARLLQERAVDFVVEHARIRTVSPRSGVAGEAGNG